MSKPPELRAPNLTNLFAELDLADQDHWLLSSEHPFEGLACVALRLDRENPRQAHLHTSSVYIVPVSGWCATLAGVSMKVYLHAPGSKIYIPAHVPHVGVSLDPDVPVDAYKFSTSRDIKGDTVRLPEFDELVACRIAALRAIYRRGDLKDRLAMRTSAAVPADVCRSPA